MPPDLSSSGFWSRGRQVLSVDRIEKSRVNNPMRLLYCIYRAEKIASIRHYTCMKATAEKCRMVESKESRKLRNGRKRVKFVCGKTNATEHILANWHRAPRQISVKIMSENNRSPSADRCHNVSLIGTVAFGAVVGRRQTTKMEPVLNVNNNSNWKWTDDEEQSFGVAQGWSDWIIE